MGSLKKRSDNASKYDVVVVLGGSISPKGELPGFIQKRVEEAIAVSGDRTPILFSGLWNFFIHYTPPRSEAAAMKAYAMAYAPKLNPETMLLEEASLDTLGSAYYTMINFLRPRSWRNILLITSEFHIARALYLFKRVLGSAYDITPRAVPSGFTPEELQGKAVLEDKILEITKHFLGSIPDGDTEAVRRILELFPGYGDHPQYTREDLRQMLDIGISVVDTYGVNNITY